MAFVYKIANTEKEFQEIHALNYRTFVEEIPQHKQNPSHVLKDKFHDENTYIICLKNEQLAGMIAVRSNRPFSLDAKIGRVENQLPFEANNLVEIRLLAIEKKYRNGRLFLGLAQALIRHCLKEGYDAALISGTMREQKLYKQLGFMPFATLTGNEHAAFQPMYLTQKTFEEYVGQRLAKPSLNFLPGPATVSDDVKNAMISEVFSHRSSEFQRLITNVKNRLTTLTNANFVQVLQGTGTLANDVVAAQLSLQNSPGLILVNGEFGKRLKDHALRLGLTFDVHEIQWGLQFDEVEIAEVLAEGSYKWLWAVHFETSTGIVNDLATLKDLCANYNLLLALDCVSGLGSIPINLQGVSYASGVSGKGLLSYTGLSFVFHQNQVTPSNHLPRYIDLGAYIEADSVPYTQSSNLMSALETALLQYEHPEKVYNSVSERTKMIRNRLEKIGFSLLLHKQNYNSSIITIQLPAEHSATRLGDNLYINGFTVHYESLYLKQRNWLQISTMNDIPVKEIENMLEVLKALNS